MKTPEIIRIGIVGAGRRATAFVKYLPAIPDVELTALCDRDPERLADFTRSHAVGKALLTTSLDEEVIDLSGETEADDGHGGGDSRFIKEFAACIRNGTEPAADLSAGLAGTVIACAIEEARRSRTVVEIPPAHYEA
jgi:predicted dehydrogenase